MENEMDYNNAAHQVIDQIIATEPKDSQQELLKMLTVKVSDLVKWMHDERLTKAEDREVVLAGFLQFVAKIENKPGAIKIIQSMAEIHPEWKNVIELVLAVM